MKILVIGGGGREHALVWKLNGGAANNKIYCAPGNGGIAGEAECVAADAGDVAELVALAERIGSDLTVVGPELPLVNGLVDAFEQRNGRSWVRRNRPRNLRAARYSQKNF